MYLVLEYAEGGDLETAIQKANSPFSESKVMFWCDRDRPVLVVLAPV